MLTIKDFLLVGDVKPYYSKYFNNNGNLYNICLEPCMSGFCVAVYVRVGTGAWEIIGEKKCTNFNFGDRGLRFGVEGLKQGQANMVLLRALKFANEFYKKFNN